MQLNGVEIEDTFAEAFRMVGSRVLITACSRQWALQAATTMTGFATSVIGCGCEAGLEREVGPEETPDGRPGASVLLFAMSKKSLADQLTNRIGQCVMTSPTSACYNFLDSSETVLVGGKLRYFGDGYQISKLLGGRRFWRIPVMEGEFLIEESFGIQEAVGGGNFLILGQDLESTLKATERAVAEIGKVRGVIMPFPGGIVRSGSKVSSKYKFLRASSNTPYCPTIRSLVDSQLPEAVNCVLEIVLDGLEEAQVAGAMRVGIRAACLPGIVRISAGNYGGALGQYHFYLRNILGGSLG